jgi:hypothetical protein
MSVGQALIFFLDPSALLAISEDWRAGIERRKTDVRLFSPPGRRIGSFHPLSGLDSPCPDKLLPPWTILPLEQDAVAYDEGPSCEKGAYRKRITRFATGAERAT